MLNQLAAVILTLVLVPQSVRSNLGVLDNRQPISVYIEDGKGVPGYHDSDPELARTALDAWSRESNGKLKFTESKERAGAIIRLRWISPTEGLDRKSTRLNSSHRT